MSNKVSTIITVVGGIIGIIGGLATILVSVDSIKNGDRRAKLAGQAYAETIIRSTAVNAIEEKKHNESN